MASNNTNLMEHDEIWDDSTLIKSWDEALEEYKQYHSIYAKRDTQALADISNSSRAGNPDSRDEDHAREAATSQEKTPEEGQQERTDVNDTMEDEKSGSGLESTKAEQAFPPGLLGSVHDEGLKKLLMSWYYAGYYTGLYEGRGQQQQQHPQ